MNQDDDSGGGPAAVGFMPPVGVEPDPTDGADVDEQSSTTDPEAGAASTPTPTTANVDLNALTAKFGDVIGEHLKTLAPKKEEPQLTPEEARKLLNVWEPDDAFLQEFGNVETQKAAFAKLRDALIRQADTIAQARMRELVQQLDVKWSPVQQMIQEQQAQQREARFAQKYPQLADAKLKPLILAVADQLRAAGKTYTDEESMFTDIAAGAASVIQATNPAFKLSAATGGAAKPTTGRIPVTSSGSAGSSGAQGNGGGETKTPKAVSFLPKVR